MSLATIPSDGLVVKGVELPRGLVLSTGTAFRTGVRGGATDLYVLLLGKKFPLPAGAPYSPGQRVVVEVAQTQPELVLRVAPGPRGAESASQGRAASGAVPLSALIPGVLRGLGAASPVATQAISDLVAVLSGTAGASESMSKLSALLEGASAAGVPLSPGARALTNLLADLASFEPADVARLLRLLADDARTSTEARVAGAIRSGRYQNLASALDQSLKAQLAQLLTDPRLRAFVEGEGALARFEAAIEQLVSRLSARDLQNLRGLDHPYLFFEFPFAEGAPLRQAFVHVFRDPPSGPDDDESGNATVVLDLATESLGPVWCTLRAQSRACRCELRAERDETRALLEGGSESLEEALRGAGYETVQVETRAWSDSRIAATARAMQRLGGVDARV